MVRKRKVPPLCNYCNEKATYECTAKHGYYVCDLHQRYAQGAAPGHDMVPLMPEAAHV